MSSLLNKSDPFDGKDCPVFKKLGSMTQWHPRIPEDKFPIWLKDYVVVHFQGTDAPASSHSVHLLFHEQFQDTQDRSMILPCLRIGHTIALFTPDKGLAVSALSFVQYANFAIVLFFATHNYFQCTGHGEFLLDLVFHILRSSNKGIDSSVYLKVNEEDNVRAYNWYSNRGFKKVVRSPTFPPQFSDAFGKEKLLAKYLHVGKEEKCLQWVTKVVKASTAYPIRSAAQRTYVRFFTNPLSTNDPSVYAFFPGDFSYQQSDNCADDSNLLSNELFKGDGPAPDPNGTVVVPSSVKPICVRWTNRCFLKISNALDDDTLDLILGWLQRHAKAEIWQKMMVFPLSLNTDLAMMHYLYLQSCVAKILPSEFDPILDNELFLRSAKPVMHFILKNKDLFKQQFITFFPRDTSNLSTCFIAINAGGINSRKSNNCGFVHFRAKVDGDEDSKQTSPPQFCAFFLAVAYAVLNCEDGPPQLSKKKKKKAVNADLLAPWFQDITEFHIFLNEKMKYTFGCELPSCEKIAGDITFPPIEFLEKHPLLQSPIKLNNSKIYAFAFWIDFCLSIVPRPLKFGNVHSSKTVMPRFSIFGTSLTFPPKTTPAQVKAHVKKLLVSIFQVTDRIAETHERRELTQEYQNFLLPASTTMRLPRACYGATYPDFAGQKWKPIERRNQKKSNPIVDVTSPNRATEDTSLALYDTDDTSSPLHPVVDVTFPQGKQDDTTSQLPLQKRKRKRLQANQSVAEAHNNKKTNTEPPEASIIVTPLEDSIIDNPLEDVMVHHPAASIQIFPCATADVYALEFNCVVTSESRKKDILWIVLRILQEANLLPGAGIDIAEYLDIIGKHLQQFRADAIVEVGDKDIVNGLPTHLGNIEFRKIIREWIQRYKSAETKIQKRKVVEEIVMSLRVDGYRFLERKETNGIIDGWQEMDFVSSRKKVVKSLTTCYTDTKVHSHPDTTGASPGVDTVQYSDKDILFGKVSNYKRKHPGNIAYQNKVMSVAHLFQGKTLANEKLEIATSVVNDLQKEGYRFVLESEEGVWNEIELKIVLQKVHKGLKDKCARQHPSKPKVHGEKDILCGQSKGAQNHPGNIAYHNKLMSVLPLFQKTAPPVEKHNIATKVVNDLQKEGYRFVVESDEGVWNEVQVEFTIRKVRLWLNDHSARAAKSENTKQNEQMQPITEQKEQTNKQTEENKEQTEETDE